MQKSCLLFAGLLLAVAAPAFAVDVSYFTTGTFQGGTTSGTSTFTAGGLKVVYSPVLAMAPNVEVPPTTNASFGSFLVSGHGTASGTFTLKITQTAPGPAASETFVSKAMTGVITASNSGVVIRFLAAGTGAGGPSALDPDGDPESFVPAQTFTLNGVQYWVDQTTKLNPQGTLQGLSSIDGSISATTPEPAFYTLTGFGLVCVFFVVRRRRHTAVI